jgi:type III secretion protein C
MALSAALELAGLAQAKPLPHPHRHVHLAPREAPVAEFIKQLLAQDGVPVTGQVRVRGSISGAFDGELQDILASTANAFGISYYYDGAAVRLYPTAERRSQAFALPQDRALRVRALAQREDLLDADDSLSLDKEGLTANGAPAFVDRIGGLVRAAEPARAKPPERTRETAPDPEQPLEYRVYRLRYGWAADTSVTAGDRSVTIPGVASILRSLVAEPDGARPAEMQTENKPAALRGLAGRGLAATPGRSTADAAPSVASTFAGLFGLKDNAPRAAPEAPAVPPETKRADPTAKPREPAVRIQADPRLNALIIRDTRDHLDAYEGLIAALDMEPALVEIEATIIDVDIEKAKQAGLSLSFHQANGTGFTSSLDGAIPNFPQAGGLSFSSVVGDKGQFIAQLEALESKGAARVVSSPLVMTLSDVEATFANNQSFYVPVNGSLSTDLYNVTAGTNLRVTPHVTLDQDQERIRLIVEIDDGSISNQLIGNLPVVRKASLNTEALILSGQSLLVGGMVSQSDSDYRARVPGAASLPLLGSLFRASRVAYSHTERLFLITPRLSPVGRQAVAPDGTQERITQQGIGPAPVARQ